MKDTGKTHSGGRPTMKRRLLQRFVKNREGATAVEFALLALPFLILIFAILEACIAFAAQQLVANATDDVARQFRTGREQAGPTFNETKLRQMVCQRMTILVSSTCPGLSVDLRQFDTFEDAAKATVSFNPDGSIKTKVDLGPALSKNMLRVYYRWPVITNLLAETLPDGKLMLFSSATWQNEPF
ncbi:TadE/TadG family type IV pilus assembly protein [Nitratireductor pacificus]|uniref:TadE-like protein n=1 Tax=Nitratireductor pacificus pht-3B TaxID=391937 RepID=K2MFI2_9HYPH|nr:TadE/TadG family type IV pilus assembly protein [Nitratireductor pacificus]EKF19465.1 TadE-like protein [Nitratireductor pacificus pht-3B]